MSISNKRTRKVCPTHPGIMLRQDFLPEYGLTVSGFARSLRVSRQTVNELLQERRAVSPEMALRLSRLFGNSPEFWLNAQREIDLWEASRNIKGQLESHIPVDRRIAPYLLIMVLPGSLLISAQEYRAGATADSRAR